MRRADRRTLSGRLIPVVFVLACLLPAAGCAPKHLPGLSRAETAAMAQAIRQQFAARRADANTTRALADVHINTRGRQVLWKRFTAVFAWQSPDRFTVSGLGPFGEVLFRYTAADGRYRFDIPGREAVTGSADADAKQPEARVLSALSHLLDGLLGPDLEGGRLRPARGGGWEAVDQDGNVVRFTVTEGRVTQVTVPRSGAGPLALSFSDFRATATTTARAPHRIAVSLPRLKAGADIRVDEWVTAAP